MSLFRREKKSFFNNLDTKKIVDNERFWRTIKPFFWDKNRGKNKITLIEEKTKIVSNNNLIAETFNKLFGNIVPSLGLQVFKFLKTKTDANRKAYNKEIIVCLFFVEKRNPFSIT